MGLKVINAAFTSKGYPADASSTILAGMVVAFQDNGSGTAELVRANRDGTHAIGAIAGLAYDDAYNVGNTQVIVDPVTLRYSSVPARKISDYKDETITVRTNWTDPGTAHRGITVLSVGGEFVSDQYITASIATGATSDGAGTTSIVPNAAWTYGAGTTNYGKLIYENGQSSTTIVARVLDGVSGSLLSFRWVGP